MSVTAATRKRTIKPEDYKMLTNRQEMEIAAGVFKKLCTAYPRHAWHVIVDKGLVTIRHLMLDAKYGYTLGLEQLSHDGSEVVMAGGEILERFKIPRGAMDFEAIMALKRNFEGRAEHDD